MGVAIFPTAKLPKMLVWICLSPPDIRIPAVIKTRNKINRRRMSPYLTTRTLFLVMAKDTLSIDQIAMFSTIPMHIEHGVDQSSLISLDICGTLFVERSAAWQIDKF
ncbi:hypothetical protein VK92_38345 [Burkholderia sp. LK4]|nr:hypothetical protein VL00_24420 [Burkholderia cepacia]KML34533.1 hypothetical protein VL13_31540 [Burkholderia lata]KMN47248.1 hypothetical protein VK92_38345 [Burkholderia sp. LK4]